MDQGQIAEFLAEVKGFSAIDREGLLQLAEQMETRSFDTGAKLIAKGADGDNMHIIRSGKVRVLLSDADGNSKLVVNLGARDLVGEMALLTGDKRNADVIADEPVETVVIDRETLQPLLREYPPLARFLTEILGKRLEQDGGMEWVGKYRLLQKIGEGATSRVYQALHPALNRLVAIKMLSHTLVYDTSFRDRFLQEARTIAGLVHPNIVQIFDTESAYATYFIVMELVGGTDLSKLLKSRRILAPTEAMDILRQMAKALSYAHEQGIVHRDVKPANCAVDKSGQVKLMDFGIARRIQKNPSQKRAKVVEGTPRYLAPEAAVGKPVDGRADIYSLGIMAFEMVTGRVPFYSETVRELLQMHVRKAPPDIERIRSGLPDGLTQFIKGALIKRPDERLVDWGRILDYLEPDGLAPDIRSREYNTELVTITYPSTADSAVRRSVERLMTDLRGVKDVELGHARVVPVGGGPGSPLKTSLPADDSEATKADVTPSKAP
ncbi:MAG: protein kinase [Deltaproteobacteria bacterium]|nr:protein kinase [Deltaproteobacteria bacterium]